MNIDNSIKNDFKQENNPIIKEGDTGDYVIILQDKLKILNYYDSSITGSFDIYTKEAVLKFQQDYGIIPTGIINNETWQALYDATSVAVQPTSLIDERPVLRLGSTGIYVTELQTLLTNLLYYNGPIDGVFGTGTETAVKRLQLNNRLTPDGVVGRDTWSALATLYSPMAICEENGNEGNYITYTVVAGDTLWALARRFNTTVDAIKSLNNLTSDRLSIGQTLLIPKTNGNITPPNYLTYTVIAGDTLWALARRFNTTVNAIKSLNNLTSDQLSIGQQLKIPSGTQNVITYTVVAGDNLWRIALRFNTTVDAIKQLNNLTSDRLSIGQQLRIPS